MQVVLLMATFEHLIRKNPPHEQPSLAIALRIDESGSMVREGRITAAQQAALAVSAFAQRLDLPLMIYGDTADLSVREKTLSILIRNLLNLLIMCRQS